VRRPLTILFAATIGLMTQLVWAQASEQEPLPPGMAPDSPEDAIPLPRWREGGTPYNADQPMHPYAIRVPTPRDAPTAGLIASPPEYEPVRGVLFRFFTNQYMQTVADTVAALTADRDHDEIAYVAVANSWHQDVATSRFIAAGADMSKVQFLTVAGDSVWLRDYGPHFIWQNGALAIVDSHYYPGRALDNFNPTLIGDDHFIMPTYDMGLYYSGGNFQPGPNRTGFVTSLVNLDNPASEGFSQQIIADLYSRYQGIDTLHVMPQLPSSVDGTGHVDMWMYLVDEDSVIISEFKPGSDPTAIDITNDAVPYMEALGFEVFRPWAWNVSSTHYTYTNAFRVNDRIFVPVYGQGNSSYLDEDADALAKWQAAAGPDVEIVPIDCYSIIPAAGAIHCIVMQVPRYTAPVPAAHIIWPDGGELIVADTTQTISWVATDTNNATVPQIDLYYSLDDAGTWTHIDTTTDTGVYDWTVPDVFSRRARIRVVATSGDSDQAEAVSADVFTICPGSRTVYDFDTGAGMDKFGWGYQTETWSNVDGTRKPVTTPLDSLVGTAYAKIAHSDATGGETDVNRYISPAPTTGREATHVFQFTINQDPADIDDIEVHWEGFADWCAQVELYVWDYVASQWSDGAGLIGQNNFMDNWAGNRDGYLNGNIRADFDRYIDTDGEMTLLAYAERQRDEAFIDFLAVTVSDMRVPGDYDDDGYVDLTDFTAFTDCLASPDQDPSPIQPCLDVFDFDDDGDVDLQDFHGFQAAFQS